MVDATRFVQNRHKDMSANKVKVLLQPSFHSRACYIQTLESLAMVLCMGYPHSDLNGCRVSTDRLEDQTWRRGRLKLEYEGLLTNGNVCVQIPWEAPLRVQYGSWWSESGLVSSEIQW